MSFIIQGVHYHALWDLIISLLHSPTLLGACHCLCRARDHGKRKHLVRTSGGRLLCWREQHQTQQGVHTYRVQPAWQGKQNGPQGVHDDGTTQRCAPLPSGSSVPVAPLGVRHQTCRCVQGVIEDTCTNIKTLILLYFV